MLKVSVVGIVFAAALFAPGLAHAYGRSGPTPNVFATWSETPEASPAQRPQGAGGFARRFHTASFRRAGGASRGWRSAYRAASVRSLREDSAGAPTFDAAATRAPQARGVAPAAVASFGGGSVVAEAARWIGSGKFTGLPGPWCADAVNVWLERSGHRPMGGRMASAALAYGPRLGGPEVGALAVLGGRRGFASHVGIVSGVDANGSIHLISGNWGHRVAEAVVPRGSVAAFVAVR